MDNEKLEEILKILSQASSDSEEAKKVLANLTAREAKALYIVTVMR